MIRIRKVYRAYPYDRFTHRGALSAFLQSCFLDGVSSGRSPSPRFLRILKAFYDLQHLQILSR